MSEHGAERPTRRFTVDEVTRMVETGILGEDEPLELIRGELIIVTPQGPRHSYTTGSLADRLREAYVGVAFVREEKPIVTSEASLPEPDVAVVRGRREDFVDRHPSGRDAILIVETAITSQKTDHEKAADYAMGGVPVYWLLDVPARRLEVHREPQPDGRYRVVHVLAAADHVEVPETTLRWRVADLLPDGDT